MVPELGIFALILALCLSVSQAIFELVGAWRENPVWMSIARPAVTGQFVFVVLAFACLVYAFVNNGGKILVPYFRTVVDEDFISLGSQSEA